MSASIYLSTFQQNDNMTTLSDKRKRFFIDFQNLLRGYENVDKCRCKIYLKSDDIDESFDDLRNHNVNIRTNFSSSQMNGTGGTVLGISQLKSLYVNETGAVEKSLFYFECDTMNTQGIMINNPRNIQYLEIGFYDGGDDLFTLEFDYQIMIIFDF